MQIFLPYPAVKDESGLWSFRNSAAVLDNKRLNKQTVEADQILNILFGKESRWKNHPAVLQWQFHEWALLEYLKDFCLECLEKRHFKNSIYDRIYSYRNYIPVPSWNQMPPWMGDEAFHSSHRSRLLFKGRVDVVVAALKKHLGVRNWSQVKFWLAGNKCPVEISGELIKSDVWSTDDIKQVEGWLVENQVPIGPNFYLQNKWQERDNLPYVWPVTKAKLEAKALVDK